MPDLAYFARAKYKNVCFLPKTDICKHRLSESARPIFDRATVTIESRENGRFGRGVRGARRESEAEMPGLAIIERHAPRSSRRVSGGRKNKKNRSRFSRWLAAGNGPSPETGQFRPEADTTTSALCQKRPDPAKCGQRETSLFPENRPIQSPEPRPSPKSGQNRPKPATVGNAKCQRPNPRPICLAAGASDGGRWRSGRPSQP